MTRRADESIQSYSKEVIQGFSLEHCGGDRDLGLHGNKYTGISLSWVSVILNLDVSTFTSTHSVIFELLIHITNSWLN